MRLDKSGLYFISARRRRRARACHGLIDDDSMILRIPASMPSPPTIAASRKVLLASMFDFADYIANTAYFDFTYRRVRCARVRRLRIPPGAATAEARESTVADYASR